MSQVNGTIGDLGYALMFANAIRIKVELDSPATTGEGGIVTTKPVYITPASDGTWSQYVVSPLSMLEPGHFYKFTPEWLNPAAYGASGLGVPDHNTWVVRPPEGSHRFVDVIDRDGVGLSAGLIWFGPEAPADYETYTGWVDTDSVPPTYYEWSV